IRPARRTTTSSTESPPWWSRSAASCSPGSSRGRAASTVRRNQPEALGQELPRDAAGDLEWLTGERALLPFAPQHRVADHVLRFAAVDVPLPQQAFVHEAELLERRT